MPAGPGAKPDADAKMVFKFKKELHTMITAYLNTRPFSEVNSFLEEVFEKDYVQTYLTSEGIKNIIDYLTKCPRNEVKVIIAEIQKSDAVLQFSIAAPKEAVDVSDTPKKNEEIAIPGSENVSDMPEANKEQIIAPEAQISPEGENVSDMPSGPKPDAKIIAD